MEVDLLATQPPLPVIGAENWGPDLNDCLTWLYEQVAANANSIQINRDQIEALEARVAVLEAMGEHIYTSYAWKFSSAAPPAGSEEIRLNNVNPALATLLSASKLDWDDADRTPVFQQLAVNDVIRLQDWDNAVVLHRFRVTGAVTYTSTNAQVPVVWTSGAGTLPTSGAAKISVGFLLTVIV